MRSWRCVIAMFLAAAVSTTHAADAEQWRLEKNENDVQIYSRAVDGWSIREIRGVTAVRASLSSVVAVVTDVAAMHELNGVVDHASTQNRESDTRYQVYSVVAMPWPVSDRDILNQREIRQDPNALAVTVIDIATRDVMALRKGLVRMDNSRQQWTLTPRPDGSVLAEMRTLAEPGGPIPSIVINAMSVSMPFHTLKTLREMVQRETYARARLAFIKERAD